MIPPWPAIVLANLAMSSALSGFVGQVEGQFRSKSPGVRPPVS